MGPIWALWGPIWAPRGPGIGIEICTLNLWLNFELKNGMTLNVLDLGAHMGPLGPHMGPWYRYKHRPNEFLVTF